MRKSIFVLAALFAATVANAQITKVGEVAGRLKVHTDNSTIGNVLYSEIKQESQVSIKIYNLSGTFIQEYKTININKEAAANSVYVEHISKNYFTSDGKICFLYYEYSGTYPNFVVVKCHVMDEDGKVVYDFTDVPFHEGSYVYNIDGAYYLVIEDILTSPSKSYIYALPGSGEATDVDEVSAPRRNIRKYLQNDQVLIDSNDKTYTIQGQEVR